MLLCKFCSKECKNNNSQRNHERLCKSNPNRQSSNFENLEFQQNKKQTNQFTKAIEKGLIWEVTPVTRKKLSDNAKLFRHSDESKQNLSRIAKHNGFGGHNSKRRLKFTKKDGIIVNLQSSYEIDFALILEELDIEWSRPDPFNWIDMNGIDHRYYPDFKIGEIYIDTKNDYLAIKDLPKIEAVRIQNNIDVRIVTKNQINKEFIIAGFA